MPDDDSIRASLERICTLQEQQLAKLSEIAERSAKAHERITELQESWRQAMTRYDDSQKKLQARATGQTIGLWVRTLLQVFMLALIVIAIIVAHYLK